MYILHSFRNLDAEQRLSLIHIFDMVVESMPQQRQMIYRMSREQHLKNEELG